MQTESALRKSQQALVVKTAIECPDGPCGAEISQAAKKLAVQLGANEERMMTFEQIDPSSDTDSDGDGLSDLVEGRVEDDGTIYCWVILPL
ncbi:hypothetical protein HRED_07097 [Candidatus Haloredivivus sp. G17]|nr:hypothetical protein HRED_07097 [Candidatus Haloredivivus sp. G17]